jgi:hypothetical protein
LKVDSPAKTPEISNARGIAAKVGEFERQILLLLNDCSNETTFPYVLDALWTCVLANGFNGFHAIRTANPFYTRSPQIAAAATEGIDANFSGCHSHPEAAPSCVRCESIPLPILKPDYIAFAKAFLKACYGPCVFNHVAKVERVGLALTLASNRSGTKSAEVQAAELTQILRQTIADMPSEVLHTIVSYIFYGATDFQKNLQSV